MTKTHEHRCPEDMNHFYAQYYDELRVIGHSRRRRWKHAATLQTTELVNESYLRLEAAPPANSLRLYFGMAKRSIDCILIENDRKRHAQKRGGGLEYGPLEECAHHGISDPDDLAIQLALERLKISSPAQASTAKLCLIEGRSSTDAAGILQKAPSTVRRECARARAQLRKELDGRAS
jgi:RNA polymerase sigma factor (TIGR02999 family)